MSPALGSVQLRRETGVGRRATATVHGDTGREADYYYNNRGRQGLNQLRASRTRTHHQPCIRYMMASSSEGLLLDRKA